MMSGGSRFLDSKNRSWLRLSVLPFLGMIADGTATGSGVEDDGGVGGDDCLTLGDLRVSL